MKKQIIVLALICISGHILEAQVSEVTRFMSSGEQNAFFASIPGVNADLAESVWEKYVKQFKGKLRRDKKTGEFFLDDAQISDLSENTIDVYYRVGESSVEVTDVYVWFDLGGQYLNSTERPETSQKASALVQQYTLLVQKARAEEELSLEEDALKDLEKDLSKLEKEKSGFEKKIEDAREMIAKMETAITQNLQEQAVKGDEITGQLERVKTAKAHVQSFN